MTTELVAAPVVTNTTRGAMGVNRNADHLGVSETHGTGNWVRSWQVPLVTYGKSRHKVKALIDDAVAGIVFYPRGVGKPIVLNKLDFRDG